MNNTLTKKKQEMDWRKEFREKLDLLIEDKWLGIGKIHAEGREVNHVDLCNIRSKEKEEIFSLFEETLHSLVGEKEELTEQWRDSGELDRNWLREEIYKKWEKIKDGEDIDPNLIGMNDGMDTESD